MKTAKQSLPRKKTDLEFALEAATDNPTRPSKMRRNLCQADFYRPLISLSPNKRLALSVASDFIYCGGSVIINTAREDASADIFPAHEKVKAANGKC